MSATTHTPGKWSKPQAAEDLSLAFGGEMAKLLPGRSLIPDDFWHGRTPWNKFVDRWFFSGIPNGAAFRCKGGVDGNTAIRHLRAIMSSFEPKHEHKTGGVAWLMSLWFDDVVRENKSLITGATDEP